MPVLPALAVTLKIVTIVGARPQFIKAATVSRAIEAWNSDRRLEPIEELIVHTGQHFDRNMSQTFFEQLAIPEPRYNLEISGGLHGEMTGRMLAGIEQVLVAERPTWVLIYGDTNSTLAGAIAASKLHIPVAHVEAGLRSFNMRMPEEVNRVLADRVSTLLLCPTVQAVENLRAEGIQRGVHDVGDVMYDAALFYRDEARLRSQVLGRFDLQQNGFILSTCHRAENTDDLGRLREILTALGTLSQDLPVILPLHPRTRKIIAAERITLPPTVLVCEPLPFLDMIQLEQNSQLIVTDSGGVQKEAYFYAVPCVTMRNETEWVETLAAGWNQLAGADADRIVTAARHFMRIRPEPQLPLYGDGRAAMKVVAQLASSIAK